MQKPLLENGKPIQQTDGERGGGKMNYIPYCTGHYTTEYCRKKAKELRGLGEYQSVKLGAYLKEDGKSYCKIYIAIKEGER